MGFSSGGSGANLLATVGDVIFSNLTSGQVLTYDSTVSKWKNQPPTTGTTLVASKDVLTSGALTLTAGTSPTLTKFGGSLTANRTITLAAAASNYVFELSFIDTTFNGFSVSITNGSFTHTFSYPTYVKYVSISGVWERIF